MTGLDVIKPELAFYQGRYAELTQMKRLPWRVRVGALAFQGRVSEARILYEQDDPQNIPDQVEAGFYLALALLRQSELSSARRLFLKHLREFRRNPGNARIGFFAFQGLAFHRYFFGQFRSSLRAAERALEFSFKSGFLYGEILGHDLLGHSLIQTGRVNEGLRELDLALEKTKALGNGGIQAAIAISSLIYRSEHGHLENPKEDLKQALSQLHPEDTYSQVDMILELGRILTWEGSFDEAENTLRNAWKLIYSSKNFRQELMLCLRFGYLALLRGEAETAFVFTESGKRISEKIFDRSLVLRIHSLEEKVREQLLGQSTSEGGGRESKAITRQGEDWIRDWIIRSKLLDFQEFIEECIRMRSHSRLLEKGVLPRGRSCIALHRQSGRILLSARSGVRAIPRLPTPLQAKLLMALGSGQAVMKEKLVKQVWGYDYHPHRHDPLLYNAVNALRRVLGSDEHLIQTHPSGYRLAYELRVIGSKATQDTPSHSEQEAPPVGLAGALRDPRLNFRQMRILELLKEKQVLDVRSCRRRIEGSEITFSRDLKFLTDLGWIRRIGQGRSTQYILNRL